MLLSPLGLPPCRLTRSAIVLANWLPQEIDLHLSATFPSVLIPALPFTHITKGLGVVSLSTIEQGQLPPTLEITKLFLASDVEELKKEFFSVKELGTGTMEEWLKGLPLRGQKHINESRKWEKWADAGHHQQVQTTTDPYHPNLHDHIRAANGSEPTPSEPGKLSSDQKLIYQDTWLTAFVPSTGTFQPTTASLVRQGRTFEEVEALKANRKLEIERRAALLDPPIPPIVLQHMNTFKAAIQITAPLDEKAWDVLQPRLLAERATAEKAIAETSKVTATVSAPVQNDNILDMPSHLEATLASTKAAKDAVDQHWEEVQAPLRAEIVRYADEVIRDKWDNGDKVNKENCCRFAAEALIHIRKRFYAEVAKEAAAAKAAGKEPVVDAPEGPYTQKLTLENMKWIFESKIKPLTQPFKKEIFYCNGCPGKPFGFEGVNQHYAAKHTSALSSGNIVVHWRAEWPEVPPFNPDGRSKPGNIGPSHAVNSRLAPPPGVNPSQPYNTNSYLPHPLPAAPPPGQPYAPAPAQIPGPPYPGQPYAEQYGQQYPGYQPPPVSYPPPSLGVPSHGYTPQPPPAWAPPGPPSYNPYQNAPPPNAYPPPHGYQAVPPVPAAPAHSLAPSPYNFPSGGYAPVPTGYPAIYNIQLDSIVRDSREVWNATANIKDLPGSVRVQVTIFHVVKRFRSKFSETPSLAMFQDGLANNKDMRPVRNINALICKACHLSLGNATSIEKDRASYSLPQLVNHFQSKHVELMLQMAPNSPPLDWTTDMILLPGHHIMGKLPGIVGSDVQKRKLFSDAFPEFFEQPAPNGVNPYYGNITQQPAAAYQPEPQQPATSYQPEQPDPAMYRPPSFDNHDKFYGPNLNPPSQPPGYHQDAGQHNGYQQPQQDYAQAPPANGYGPPQPQPAAYHEHAAPASAPNPAVSAIAGYEAPGRGKSGSQSSQGSRPPRDSTAHQGHKSGKNKNGRGKNDDHDDPARATGRGLCRRCNKPGHFARDCAENPIPKTNSKEVQVKVEDEERQREAEIRAIWDTDRANVARADRRSKAEPEKRQQATPNMKTSQDRAMKRSGNHHTPQQRETPPALRSRTAHPAREEPSLLDALEMQLEQAERPSNGQRSRGQTYTDNDGRLPVPEPLGSHQRADVLRYEQAPRLDHQRTGSPGYQSGHSDPSYRLPPPPGNSRLIPADEYGYERRREPAPARLEALPAQRPDMPPHDRDPYDRRYGDDEIVYERPSAQEYRPHPDAPLPPQSRPTGQLYEIVEVSDEQGRYLVRRPIGYARPPPSRYDYPYEDEGHLPRYSGAPEQYAPRPMHPDAEAFVPRGQPAAYEPDYPREAQRAPEPAYPRGRTQAPPEAAYARGPPEHSYGRHDQPAPREEYPLVQPRDSRNYRPVAHPYEQEEEEYDPRNPAAR